MKPFQISGRKGWHAEVRLADGRVTRRAFPYRKDAQAWMTTAQAQADAEAQAKDGPTFGGPDNITLGALLTEYAARFTIGKAGFKNEIDRINHYLAGADLPRLVVEVDAEGRRYLRHKTQPTAIPKG